MSASCCSFGGGLGSLVLQMADCEIKRKLSGNPEELFAEAKRAAEREKAVFQGTAKSGSFTAPSPVGNVTGTYKVEGDELNVSITSKPWLASCSAIDDKFTEFLKTACPSCNKR